MKSALDRKKSKEKQRASQNLFLEDPDTAAGARRVEPRSKKGLAKDEHPGIEEQHSSDEEQGQGTDDDSSQQRGYVSVTLQQGRQEELITNDGMELVIDASRSMEIDSIFPESQIADIYLSTQPLGFGVRVLPEEGLEVSLQDESLLTFTGPSQAEKDGSNFLTLRIIAIENEEIFLKIQVDSTANPRPNARPKAVIKGYPSMHASVPPEELEQFVKTPHLNFRLTTVASSLGPGHRERRCLIIRRPTDGKEVLFRVREVQSATPVLDCTITIPHQDFRNDWNVVTDEWLVPSFEIVEEGNVKLRGYTETSSELPT